MVFVIESGSKLPAFKKRKKVIKIIVIIAFVFIPAHNDIFIIQIFAG